MPTANLKNITIQQKETSTFKTYYLIKNNDNPDEAYFAFERSLSHFSKWRQWTVKEGWNELVNNWENIREVEIEFEEKEEGFKIYRKVVSLYTQLEGEIFV